MSVTSFPRVNQRISRLRKPRSPTAARATTISTSHRSGAAETSPPGSFGTWAKGERSSTRLFSCSGRPNYSISAHAARTAQPPNAMNRGSTPNRATATPTSTQTAGSCTRAAPSTRAISWPTSPALSP